MERDEGDTVLELDSLIQVFVERDPENPSDLNQNEKVPGESTNSAPNEVDGIVFEFNKDCFAISCEPIQKLPFLYEGKVPAVDMRVETSCLFPGHEFGWCRFSGAITKVHGPPTAAELAEMPPPFQCDCGQPDCKLAEATEESMVRCFGAMHGQRVTAHVVLNFDFYHRYEGLIDPKMVYEIVYRADTNKQYIWNVVEAKRADPSVDYDHFVNSKVWNKECDCGCIVIDPDESENDETAEECKGWAWPI